jgi:hypothetical protein
MIVNKEVEFVQNVDIEVDLADFDDDDLIQELVDRAISAEDFAQQVDEQMNDWEFTRKMRDYFVAEMAKHETDCKVLT